MNVMKESIKADMPASSMKLIHSGKVLKDTDSVDSVGIKENDFLVVMVTKQKKPATPLEQPEATPAAEPLTSAPVEIQATVPPVPLNDANAETVEATTVTTASPPTETTTATTTSAPTVESAVPPPIDTDSLDEFATPEMVANLTALGFPETEVRHCLRAAQGNPDIAVEFLTNGIPSFAPQSTSSPNPPLQALRNHPQFNDLRRLVQSNPAMLQQVLTQIGQQQPDLLREINANQAAFLELMNEPIPSAPAPPPPSSQSQPQTTNAANSTTSSTSDGPIGSSSSRSRGSTNLANADPMQMAQMMQNMDPGQLQMMATMMGLSPEQVQAVGRMIGQLPPEQFQEYMAQAMGNPASGDSGGPGPHVLRLTEEEMASVDRLTEMGFDRSEAAQAYLACDKNEAMAANLLMDGGFGFGGLDEDEDDDPGMGGGDEDEDMYS